MRILLLCQKLPLPLEDGYNLRIQAYVRRLAARHEIHLVSLDQGSMPADMQACFKSIRTAGIRKVPRATTLVQRVFQAFSADHLHDFDPDVMRVVEEAAASAEFDLIWVSGWKMLPYSRRLKNAPPVFGDVIDEGAQEAVVELRKTRSPRDFLYRYKELCAIRGFERQYFASQRPVLIRRALFDSLPVKALRAWTREQFTSALGAFLSSGNHHALGAGGPVPGSALPALGICVGGMSGSGGSPPTER